MSTKLLNSNGGNAAVRSFLCFLCVPHSSYWNGMGTVGTMRGYLERCGFDEYCPDWARGMSDETRLDTAMVEAWLRHLFACELEEFIYGANNQEALRMEEK